jgi:hypothetical protein
MELSIEGDPLKTKIAVTITEMQLQNEIETIRRKIERLG